jgi:hypothetical protein
MSFWAMATEPSSPATFTISRSGGWTGIGDFNGDGKLDLALLNQHSVTMMLNSGTARFFPTSPIQFPKQLVNTTGSMQSVTLVNTGKAPLVFQSFSVSGNFTASNNCGNSLATGAKCTIQASFTPRSAGYLSGAIMINDSASSQPQYIYLRGTATAVQVSPTALNFGSQKVGNSSPPQVITVTNVSDTAVNFGAFSIVGPDLKDFSIDSQTCGTQIAPGASCTATVTFRPKKTRNKTAAVFVNILNRPDPLFEVALTGTGT